VNEDIIIGTMIRKLRRDRDLPQSAIADALGLPQTVITRIERGDRRMSMPELRRLCALLGVALVDFVAEYESRITASTEVFTEK